MIGITNAQKSFRRITIVVLGCALTLGGFVGLFLPFVPGELLIGVGLLMVGTQHAWLRQRLEKCRAQLPLVQRTFAWLLACCEGFRRKFMNHAGDFRSQSGALQTGQPAAQGPNQSRHITETLSDTRKVLIFDENGEDLARHAEPFEAQGFEVYKCMSIETVMRCVEREEFDFALVDQVSPAFEGLRVIRHLVRYNLRTPFVVVARHKDKLCYQQALALGAMDYLEKPVPNAEMNWLIDHYFGNFVKS